MTFSTRIFLLITLLASGLAGAASASTNSVTKKVDYQYNVFDPQSIVVPALELPDLSSYNRQNIDIRVAQAKTNASRPVIEVATIFGEHDLVTFTAGGRGARWAKLQGSVPKVIYIRSGFATPVDIANAVKDSKYFEYSSSAKLVISRLPIVVQKGATLVIDSGTTKTVKLSQDRGTFLVSAGTLAILDTQIVGWNETKNAPAWYEDKDKFRPFITIWGGSELYMDNSHVMSLGYNRSKSYGLSISQYFNKKLSHVTPIAWILGSTFEDLYYGFYCYEADGLAVINNTYKNNIIYGIDPHDRSSHLIFAKNTVYGTKVKHGIIGSRSVDKSWFIDNVSYNNKLSGFVLDRNCINNVIVGNHFYNNGTDGVALYESGKNTFIRNQISGNQHHGISIRNSVDTRLFDNFISGNRSYAIYGHIEDLAGSEHRDSVVDPYTQHYSFVIRGGEMKGNLSGVISATNPDYIRVADISILHSFKKEGFALDGPLQNFYSEFFETILRDKKGFELLPKVDGKTSVD